MARTAAVPTGFVRLTDADRAWIEGTAEARPERIVVFILGIVLHTIFVHSVEKDASEMYDRAVVVQVVGSYETNGVRVTGKAATRLAENAIRSAIAAEYLERVWSEQHGVNRLRLTEVGLALAERAWGASLRESLNAASDTRSLRELEESLVGSDTPTGKSTTEEGEA